MRILRQPPYLSWMERDASEGVTAVAQKMAGGAEEAAFRVCEATAGGMQASCIIVFRYLN